MATEEEPKVDDSQDTSAADEPTAMWGADALKQLGLEDAAKAHEEPAPAAAVPAKKPVPTKATPKARPKTVPKKGAGSGAMSWAVTIALAVALGVAVYFAVGAFLG